MKSLLLRTGSVPVMSSLLPGSPRVSFGVHDSFAGGFSGEKSSLASPRISLHFQSGCWREVPGKGIRRALSESDIMRSVSVFSKLNGAGSRSCPAMINEDEEEEVEEEEVEEEEEEEDGGQLIVKQKSADRVSCAGAWPEIEIPVEELGFSGGGADGNSSGSFTGGGSGDRLKLAAHYEEMLKLNPGDALLLRNYGKFLHEVEKDSVRAEEYYGRAILANPGDGEVLSLYARLIWETERDQERAQSYFDQAVSVSPNDCMVMGSYAQFMWETEEEEEEQSEAIQKKGVMVEAF